MSTEDNSLPAGGEALPAATQNPAADAAFAQPAAAPVADDAAKLAQADADKKAAEEGERKKNRTTAYIDRLKASEADLRRRLADLESRSQPPAQSQRTQQHQPADTGPTLEDCDYNLTVYQQKRDQWVIAEAQKAWSESQRQQASTAREQATWQTYEQKSAEFADAHPDFEEVVGSIAYPLPDATQAAIAVLPNGPEIAYHLGNNDDDAYELARTPPHLAEAAVRRLAARLGAAPPPVIPAAQAPAQPKPITKAPPPAPTVSGRSPTEIPEGKLTDDQWFERRKAESRKR